MTKDYNLVPIYQHHLPCVDLEVILEGVTSTEGLSAQRTLERFHTSVASEVRSKMTDVNALFVTHRALRGFIASRRYGYAGAF